MTLYSLHIQKTNGMKAPMATKIGNMAEDSSSAQGSAARGPLGLRFLPGESVIWSLIVSSSVSLGSGGNVGQSEIFQNSRIFHTLSKLDFFVRKFKFVEFLFLSNFNFHTKNMIQNFFNNFLIFAPKREKFQKGKLTISFNFRA